jgi:hypothetical protein
MTGVLGLRTRELPHTQRLANPKSYTLFDAYWKFHEQQEYEPKPASHYANHRVPGTVPSTVSSSRTSRRSGLKIVGKE